MVLNAKQQRTLERLFERPTPAEMPWDDIESLFRALGVTMQQRAGSRISVTLNGRKAIFHVPHPARKARQERIRDVRTFLENAGVGP